MTKTKPGLHAQCWPPRGSACVPVCVLPRRTSGITSLLASRTPRGPASPGRVRWVGTPCREHLFPPGSAQVPRRMLTGCCWAREPVLGEGYQPGPPGHSSVQPLSSASCVSRVTGPGYLMLLEVALYSLVPFLLPPVEWGWVWGSGRPRGWLTREGYGEWGLLGTRCWPQCPFGLATGLFP